MQIESIKFAQGENGADPKAVTVTLTIEEAIWISLVAGKTRGSGVHSEIYGCLTGDLFNRYWDDGVKDAFRAYPIEDVPPIGYPA